MRIKILGHKFGKESKRQRLKRKAAIIARNRQKMPEFKDDMEQEEYYGRHGYI
jgi:hypothetical protein